MVSILVIMVFPGSTKKLCDRVLNTESISMEKAKSFFIYDLVKIQKSKGKSELEIDERLHFGTH
jgi:hypothetical protein